MTHQLVQISSVRSEWVLVCEVCLWILGGLADLSHLDGVSEAMRTEEFQASSHTAQGASSVHLLHSNPKKEKE